MTLSNEGVPGSGNNSQLALRTSIAEGEAVADLVVAALVDGLGIKGEDLAPDVLNLNLNRGESVWILIWSSGREPEASRSNYCDSGGIGNDLGASGLTSHHRSMRMNTDFWGLGHA
jgi:hypothetical protein